MDNKVGVYFFSGGRTAEFLRGSANPQIRKIMELVYEKEYVLDESERDYNGFSRKM